MPQVTKLDMIYDAVLELRDGQKEIKKCVTGNKVKIAKLETVQKELVKDFDEHRKDPALHYNPYYNETLPDKLKRKKGEVGAITGLSSIIAGVILFLLEHWGII